ncbi:MAG: cyclic nucleotide-binding domain-containing protein [Defluviitaleaceae bacterium]|nr:cyclic nucleotide-binding domain-containing protein [Defluviitaleaceae bacterium]
MPLSEFNHGDIICKEGDPLSRISFITKGSVNVIFSGRAFRFEQGDTIGLCAISEGSHSCTYTANSDVTIVSYPYENICSLKPLFNDNADVADRLVQSVTNQLSGFLRYRTHLKKEADDAYGLIGEIYPEYERLCELYAFSSKKILEILNLIKISESDPVKDWVHSYYMEIKNLDPATLKGFFHAHVGISSGFFHRGTEDIHQVLQACKLYQEHLKEISKIFISDDGHDLFALLCELHLSSINIKGADDTVGTIIAKLTEFISNMTYINQAYYQERLETYRDNLATSRITNGKAAEDAPASSALKQNLSNSLDTILEYSEYPDELCNKFARLVHEYIKVPDRSSPEDTVYSLRRELTGIFNDIYKNVLIKSLDDPATPTVIKMFLNFGYVDATLAGHKNADFLYGVADSLKGNPDMDVYTLPEWLAAIYRGEKEPSRNDFDIDYTAHIREMKQMRKIDEKEEARLLADLEEKLRFELDNVFPVVNKITFGRISAFCPLFSDHNVQRNLEAALVTPAALKEAFNDIRIIDPSAYFRETLYSNSECGITKEFVHIEVMPEIILMPNVGVRGAMWQEMDGRKYSTPARMFMSTFLLNDLSSLVMRLTGEFRWEMCKRIQGPRWSDLSYPSLTSEFFDYMQFYRSNRELSADVKSAIKTDLVRARNNYKEVFVSNYIDWLMYESKGSPRLNKVARKVLLEYCPFPALMRAKLATSPQFTDLFKRYDLKLKQRARVLQNVIQKAERTGKKAPKEILDELEYIENKA